MSHRRNLIVVALLALVALGVAVTLADTPEVDEVTVNASEGLTLAGPGLALHGYDAVAYFTQGEPVRGSAKHSAVHRGATYRFASAEHLRRFESDPDRYVPQFGGFCAYGVSVGAKFDGDPHLWRIVNGKLYLNLNEDIQNTWLEDVPGNIAKAEKNWRRIESRSPESLK